MFAVKISLHRHQLLRLPRAKQCFSNIISTFSTEQNISILDHEDNKSNNNKEDSILFNTVVNNKKLKLGWRRNKGVEEKIKRIEKEMKAEEIRSKPITSVAFKYISDEYKEKLLNELGVEKSKPEPRVVKKETNIEQHVDPIDEDPDFKSWYEEIKDSDEVVDPMELTTEDPNVPPSIVPCGGCGAILHCQDANTPGFITKEIFKGTPDKHLRALICQRCHYFKHYSTALNVNVSPEDYPVILGELRKKRALVLLLVDLMDFPCSVWPQLSEVIGNNRPVCIVGNKVDLLPADSKGYLSRVISLLKTEVQKVTGLDDSNIKHVALISAKTGYGIEELINKIHKNWEYKGDVYLVGCTNVGKSTLFNALITSDLCKVKAVNIVQRATTSPWPGTTLNLLKFPMMRPESWRMFTRTQRIIHERKAIEAAVILRKEKLRETRKLEYATLTGHVGQTFKNEIKDQGDMFSMRIAATADYDPGVGLDPRDPELKDSRWCFDTPGTIQTDQVLNLLTEEELELTLPNKIISPQTFNIKPEQSVLIAGLGRLDFLQGSKYIMMTVFTSSKLPVTVCWTREAPSLYSKLLGTELLAVPCGDEERMAEWPGLAPGPVLTLEGQGWKESCADVVLSSAGWIAITVGTGYQCTLQAHTPHARGIYVRQPPLLGYAVDRKGAKIRYSPAYRHFRPLLE